MFRVGKPKTYIYFVLALQQFRIGPNSSTRRPKCNDRLPEIVLFESVHNDDGDTL